MEAVGKRVGMAAAVSSAPCIFCQIARSSTSTTLLHKDDKVVAFQDINPSAFRFQTATIMYALGCCPAQCTITILAVIVYAHDRDLLVSRRKVYGYNTIPEYESREVWEDPLWTLVSISKSPRTLNSERHYLVIPIEHISTVKDLQRRSEDFLLVNHMLNVGQSLIQRDAPHVRHYRFGFHQPPFNSVNHLHLHCFTLPFTPRWKAVKYLSLGPFGGFIEAGKLLERIKP